MTDTAFPPQPNPPPAIPPHFEPHLRRSGLTDPWQPLYSRRTADAIHIGLRAGPAHANGRGFVHGGLLTALADNAMGWSCIQVRGDDSGGLVTVNLAMDFVATARLGQWIEICPTVIRVGKSLSFASALVKADDKVCARANATFQAVPR